jgi:hypothetical protein
MFTEVAQYSGGLIFPNMRIKLGSQYTADDIKKFVFKRVRKLLRETNSKSGLSE